MDKDYNGIMIKKYHIEEENVREQVFENVSLSSLNKWLGSISTNLDVSNLKYKISLIKNQIENIYQTSIKPLEDEVKQFEVDIKNIKKDRKQNVDTKRILKIIDQAVSQNPDNIVLNTKRLLLDGSADFMINLNKIDELTENEKEELYEQYVYEFKVMAGIIQPKM